MILSVLYCVCISTMSTFIGSHYLYSVDILIIFYGIYVILVYSALDIYIIIYSIIISLLIHVKYIK